ncbi:MAG: hypothetical protein PW790_05835 [Parvibaculaceae bacterium]|nr:hypothetical protein [Parvibaculaceae bacterium]
MARSLKTGKAPPAKAGPLLTPSRPAGDRRWKALTAAGNAAFAQGRREEAERCYAAALAEAEAAFSAFRAGRSDPDLDAAAMLVIASANAADNWLDMGQGRRAGEQIVMLCRRLCAALESDDLALEVRERCFLHLRPAVMELMDKLPRAGWPADAVAHEAGHVRAVALRFIGHNSPRH